MTNLTAIYKKSGRWYLGWIEEIPGVNTQGKTIKETKKNLREALRLIVETNRLAQCLLESNNAAQFYSAAT